MYLYTAQSVQGNEQIPEQGLLLVSAQALEGVWCGVAALSSPCLGAAWHSDRPAPLEHSFAVPLQGSARRGNRAGGGSSSQRSNTLPGQS